MIRIGKFQMFETISDLCAHLGKNLKQTKKLLMERNEKIDLSRILTCYRLSNKF